MAATTPTTQTKTVYRWSAIKDPNLKRLFVTSILLIIFSLMAIIFKGVSQGSWVRPETNIRSWQPEDYKVNDFDFDYGSNNYTAVYFTYFDMPTTGEYSYQHVDIRGGPGRFLNTHVALVYVAAVMPLVFSLITILTLFTASATGAMPTSRGFRNTTHALYTIVALLPMAVFAYLTAAHSQSARFYTSHEGSGPDCVGLCAINATDATFVSPGNKRFDLETWACDIRATQKVYDLTNVLGRVCVGETGARGMMAVLAVVGLVVVVLMQLDRKGSQLFMGRDENEELKEKTAGAEGAGV